MPTAHFSTEGQPFPATPQTRPAHPERRRLIERQVGPARRAVRDVAHLLRFRASAVRRPWLAVLTAGIMVAVVLGVAIVPALTPGAGGGGHAFDILLVLPSGFAGFLALAVVSAIASGGGRELVAHEHASIFPISPTTDHLGALLMAPLNIAWMLQSMILVGATSYALGPGRIAAAEPVVVLWLAAATAVAQVLAWTLEYVRRSAHGPVVVRSLTVVLLGAALLLQLSDRLTHLLDKVPTSRIVEAMAVGVSWQWLATVLALVALFVVAAALGAVPAHYAARRIPRDELKAETGSYAGRKLPRTALAALVRTDRGSVWRAVPMRRGMLVLAVGPGVVALLGNLQWATMTVLPGLVASGGALLFGVNSWCLDGRGGLWRESLPVNPATVFAARAYVLAEFLVAASAITLALAALRAGLPTAGELAALLCTWVVVVLQVVSSSMRWSSRRPFAVDLRSARATPAPPTTMVGYSTKLAVGTTLTSLVFSGLAHVDAWQLSIVVATPFVLWSGIRLLHARDGWVDPVSRARVVTTVAL